MLKHRCSCCDIRIQESSFRCQPLLRGRWWRVCKEERGKLPGKAWTYYVAGHIASVRKWVPRNDRQVGKHRRTSWVRWGAPVMPAPGGGNQTLKGSFDSKPKQENKQKSQREWKCMLGEVWTLDFRWVRFENLMKSALEEKVASVAGSKVNGKRFSSKQDVSKHLSKCLAELTECESPDIWQQKGKSIG